VDTPAFLLWSLEFTCQVRGFEVGRDPERIERLLRGARAASDAAGEGRVLEGICVSSPYGFRLREALAIYGGLEVVESCCTACPANAASRRCPGMWAGCFGLAPVPEGDELQQRLVAALSDERLADEHARVFLPTQPIWHGLWLRSPLDFQQTVLLAAIMHHGHLAQLSSEFADLQAGLHSATNERLPLHFARYPPGRVEQGWWRLATHCPRCKVVWTDERARHCVVCDYVGPPAPDKKRRARGRRPYVLLERLLGGGAAEFVKRFEAFRAQQERPARAQFPLRPEPPDSLPDD
jgi:hypothetical protein